MTEMEKKLLEELDTAAQDMETPESLLPEQVCRRLEAAEEEKKTRQKKQKKTAAAAAFSLAACLALVLVATGVMGGKGLGTGGEADTVSENSAEAEEAEHPEDYSDIYACLEKSREGQAEMYNDGGYAYETATADAAQASGNSMARAEAGSYSGTNVRTEGVGEADLVKTDGTWLYVLKENGTEISIVDVSGDAMKEAGKITLPEDVTAQEFYVEGSSLFVLGVRQTPAVQSGDGSYYDTYQNSTVCMTYDISSASEPEETDTLEQSGYYVTSRFAGGYLYLFSQFDVGANLIRSDMSTYVPQVQGSYLEAGRIFLPAEYASQYLVVTAVNLENPGETTDRTALLSDYGQCYVGSDSIYIYETKYDPGLMGYGTEKTSIVRLPYGEGTFGEAARGEVPGYVHDSFCIDEYDGFLRVVTTVTGNATETCGVYILDKDMKVTGKIEDLARGETVYSARLMGETGYFVTYRQVDPLFSVDLSDPEQPSITGSLKIPGFSEYLHPYGDGLLLGIGMDTDAETGITEGAKLSMFDISNPEDVKEVAVYVLEGMYYTSASNDYRAVLADVEKNLIGFSATGDQEEFFLFQYDEEKGFLLKLQEEVNGGGWLDARGVYIGNTLYVVKGNAIESYDLKSGEKLDDILL